MKQIVKIQHYVPRLYLRNFSIVHKKKCHVFCFDKVQERVFPSNIEDIAAEKYFYDMDKGKNQIVEKALGNLESMFNAAYDKLLQTEDLHSLSDMEKAVFAYFIAVQELRTREFREFIRDLARQLEKRLSGYELTEDLRNQLEAAKGEKSVKSIQAKMLIQDAPKCAKIMVAMKWILLINKTKLPNWSSDQPINRHNDIDHSPYGNLGLESKGIQIYFPLSTKVSLLLCDPFLFKILPEKLLVANEENVIFQNSLQVLWSTRHVFSRSDAFALARKIITEHPELKDVNRPRFSVL